MARPTPRRKRPGAPGRMSDDRAAWARTIFGDFVVYDSGGLEEAFLAEDHIGETIRLQFHTGGRKKLAINLTTATLEELEAIEKLFQYAFDRARPVCAERDRVAQEAFNNGDDSYARLYRQVPQFIIRERTKREHAEGVHDGPVDVPAVVGDGGEHDAGLDDVRSPGDGVAEQLPDGDRPQDDEPTTHDVADLRSLGEVDD